MSVRNTRASIIWAIVLKDLREFSRDRLWMILTPISLVAFIGSFWFLPDSVDETIAVGIYPASLVESLGTREEGQALEVVPFDDEDELVAAVSGAGAQETEVSIGIAFSSNFLTAAMSGQSSTVTVYVRSDVPEELRHAVCSGIREVGYALQAAAAGLPPAEAFPVTLPDEETIVLGEDRAGAQVPLRERLRPLFAFIILMIEALALAGLVAIEIEQRTVSAMLVTPARTSDVLLAKGITGTLLGLSQGLLFLLATSSFGEHVLLVLVMMLLGAVMMSAIGMLSGSLGRDFMSTLFYGMTLITPLMIPALSVLFPGSASLWVQLLPSHGLIEALVGSIGYGKGWGELWPFVGMTLLWDIALFGVALFVLRRKVVSL